MPSRPLLPKTTFIETPREFGSIKNALIEHLWDEENRSLSLKPWHAQSGGREKNVNKSFQYKYKYVSEFLTLWCVSLPLPLSVELSKYCRNASISILWKDWAQIHHPYLSKCSLTLHPSGSFLLYFDLWFTWNLLKIAA